MFLSTYREVSLADPVMLWVLNTMPAAASSKGSRQTGGPHSMVGCECVSHPPQTKLQESVLSPPKSDLKVL